MIPKQKDKRQQWIDICNLSHHFNHLVCWQHFRFSDFIKEISQEDIDQCQFGKLKKNIIPSQNLPRKTDTQKNLEDIGELKNEPIENEKYEDYSISEVPFKKTKVNPGDDNFVDVYDFKQEPIDSGYEVFSTASHPSISLHPHSLPPRGLHR